MNFNICGWNKVYGSQEPYVLTLEENSVSKDIKMSSSLCYGRIR
jgi:hypothetical protein